MSQKVPEGALRPSALSNWDDCPRRGAARLFWKLLAEAGFEIPRIPVHIGAATGSGTHAAATVMLKAKEQTGELGSADDANQAGIEELRKRVEEGVLLDDVSPSMNVAEKQVIRQAAMYRGRIAPHLKPHLIEKRLEAKLPSGLIISGEVDVTVLDGPDTLHDLKTGRVRRCNAAQMGSYSLILRSHGEPMRGIVEDYVPRVALNKEQPNPQAIPYDIAESEQLARGVMRRLERDLAEFKETGNPGAFGCNLNSYLCSPKYCSAFRSEWCPESKLKGGNGNG